MVPVKFIKFIIDVTRKLTGRNKGGLQSHRLKRMYILHIIKKKQVLNIKTYRETEKTDPKSYRNDRQYKHNNPPGQTRYV